MGRNKIVQAGQAVACIKDGMSLMVGGFMTCGAPMGLVGRLAESGIKGLTIISNDAGYPGIGVGALIRAGAVKTLIATHIGLNPEAGEAMNDGRLEVILVPQGTMAERIRAAGAGLGGILTPTGVGTVVQEGKEVLAVGGKEYLLELPLGADVALLSAYQSDPAGNLFYRGSARNFNPVMATAAGLVVVEADQIVSKMVQEHVHTPGLFVDYIVERESAIAAG